MNELWRNISLYWETKIFQSTIENFDEINKNLDALFCIEDSIKLEKSKNIFLNKNKHVSQLKNIIYSKCLKLISTSSNTNFDISSNEYEIIITGFARITKPGFYEKLQRGDDASWSGLYCISVKNPSAVFGITSGRIDLQDPRPRVSTLFMPGMPFGRPLNVTPHPGLLIIFPSWVPYLQNPILNNDLHKYIIIDINIISNRGI